MILKGSARSGATDLALHLGNEIDNEVVTIAEMRGMASNSLYDGFREWELICDQTKASKAFYSLSINPDANQRDWSDTEWTQAINHIEEALGLTDQPRAIIFHEKAGASDGNVRKHAHVVWSRINPETLKAVHMAHDYRVLGRCTKELAQAFDLDLSYKQGRDKIHGHDQSLSYDQAMSHGKNRDVETSVQRKATITALWAEHQAKAAFEIAVSNAGYVIAQGDKRGFVVVDCDGQVHSLARQIDGVRVREVKDRLGEPDGYPSVDQAKDEQKIRLMDIDAQATQPEPAKRLDLTREQKLFAKLRRMARRTDELRIKRQEELQARRDETDSRYKAAQDKLQDQFKAEQATIDEARKVKAEKRPDWLSRFVPYDMLLKWKHAHEDHGRVKAFEKREADLEERYIKQQEWIARKADQLVKQEKREARSFERLAKKMSIDDLRAFERCQQTHDHQYEMEM